MNFSSPLVNAAVWREQTIYSDVWAESGLTPDFTAAGNYYLFIMNFLGKVFDRNEVVTIANPTFPPFPQVALAMDAANIPPAPAPEPTRDEGAEYYFQVMNFLGKPIGG